MKQKLISMTEKEISRHNVIKNLIDGKINDTDASKQLYLSIRQVKRIKANILKHGVKGIIHGNRDRQSNRRINSNILEKILAYLKEKYYNFGPTLTQEKLAEIDKIEIGVEALRQLMIKEKLWKPRPRKQPKKEAFLAS